MKKTVIFLIVGILSACSALSGKEYSVNAYNAQGQQLNKKFALDSNKAGIQMARQSLCQTYPNATIRVYNNITRTEVKEFSPYSCRLKR
ncbi:hypothetical protein [Neisseria iguanae]|uniref:Uncharacterized protein n=1 Tax=Neisseria iguanae TaxID=90242 RepID=A0A2P7U2B1_9NEIS|nr:hypothetical protein [Neisseria iguanae]PSJ81110.1 hypothetical protein C7N83_02440 [Neisseria iguanae]